MKRIYVIAGCNGAGKTTASYTILPEILNCREFVNTDEIAKGLSPFQPDKMKIEAGRIMLNRIKTLIERGESFAFETTLASRTFVGLLESAKQQGYRITLLFFWLNSPDLAVHRVNIRVEEGGHTIPEEDIRRRYERGLTNFFQLYEPVVHNWMFINNSGTSYEYIAEGTLHETTVNPPEVWEHIKFKYDV